MPYSDLSSTKSEIYLKLLFSASDAGIYGAGILILNVTDGAFTKIRWASGSNASIADIALEAKNHDFIHAISKYQISNFGDSVASVAGDIMEQIQLEIKDYNGQLEALVFDQSEDEIMQMFQSMLRKVLNSFGYFVSETSIKLKIYIDFGNYVVEEVPAEVETTETTTATIEATEETAGAQIRCVDVNLKISPTSGLAATNISVGQVVLAALTDAPTPEAESIDTEGPKGDGYMKTTVIKTGEVRPGVLKIVVQIGDTLLGNAEVPLQTRIELAKQQFGELPIAHRRAINTVTFLVLFGLFFFFMTVILVYGWVTGVFPV